MQSTELDNVTRQDVKSRKDSVLSHKLLTQTVYDFAENTTLNGLKYIVEKGVSSIERLFWIFTFILSTVLCIFMVHKSYEKYVTSGVAVTLKEYLVSVNEYPFPAVTICPMARIRQSKYNFSKFYLSHEVMSASELKKLQSVKVFCERDEHQDGWMSKHLYRYRSHNYSIDIGNFFEAAPKHENVFLSCNWRNEYIGCSKLFRPVLTRDGICYTFNSIATDQMFRNKSVYQKRYYLNASIPQKGWSLEKNYYDFDNDDAFPRRGRVTVAAEDLSVYLKEIPDRDFACEKQIQPGYKVYLHHPADLPQASHHSYTAQPETTTSFAIKLDILDTSKELVGYPPQTRQCYFPNERYLQFFQKYTSLNCQLECLTNYTIHVCGCVNFFMPRNESTAICKSDKHCMDVALDRFANQEDSNDSTLSSCQCLPSCKDVSYDAEVILTKQDRKEYLKRVYELLQMARKYATTDSSKSEGDSDETESDSGVTKNGTIKQMNPRDQINLSKQINPNDTKSNDDNVNYRKRFENMYTRLTNIKMYYRRPRFMAMQRSELIGMSQFLADVGGTLGLFLGFSFLTLAEIFYFFTLKMFYKYRQERNGRTEERN